MTVLDAVGWSSALVVIFAMFLAGMCAAIAAAVTIIVTRRASFAVRAAVLQACTLALLVVSMATFVPRPAVGDRVPRVASRATAPAAIERNAATLTASVFADRMSALRAVAAQSETRAVRIGANCLVGLWLMGIALMVWRMLAGIRQLAGIRRRATRSSVYCALVSDEVDIPFVYGCRSPVIIVPATSESWADSEWQAVLGHEATHITRGDVVMQWIRQITLALHWMNPAVRWMIKRTEEACEGACDDEVLLQGASAGGYAATLLSFVDARWLYAATPVPTLVGCSSIERRVLALGDRARPRRRASFRDRQMTRLAGLLGGVAAALVAPRPAIGFPSDSQFAAHTTASPKQAPPRRAPSGDARPAAAAAAAAVATARLPLRGDTTEALIGLGALLSDTNPMVREAATSALQAWGRKAIVVLEPVVRGSDRASRANARAALAALRVDRLGGDR